MYFKSLLKLTLGAIAVAGTMSATAQTYTYENGQEFTFNGKVYQVTGDNVVSNYDFANGTYDGWVRGDNGDPVTEADWEISDNGVNGAKYLHNTGNEDGGSNSANNIRCGWNLEPNKTYFVSYYTIHNNQYVGFYNTPNEGVNISGLTPLMKGTDSSDWMQNAAIFTTTEEAHNAVLSCGWCGNTFGLTYICIVPVEECGEAEVTMPYLYKAGDEINVNHKIYRVTGANIVPNYDFADGNFDGWVSTDAGNPVAEGAWEVIADGVNGANYLHCTGNKSGGSGSENNIRCAWELEANTTYFVSYWTTGSNSNVRFWNSNLEGVKAPDNDAALLSGTDSDNWMQNSTVFTTTDEAHKALLNLAWCGNKTGVTYICIVPVEFVQEEQVEYTDVIPNTFYRLQIVGHEDFYLAADWIDGKRRVLTLSLNVTSCVNAFKFVPIEGKENTYNMIGSDGRALWADGDWDFSWNSTPTADDLANATYQFTVYPEVGYLTIKTAKQYVGSDGIWDWSILYTDKSDNMIVKFVPIKVDDVVGVEAVEAAQAEGAVEYFNLQGVRVANPENGLFIRRQGDKATKVFIR